MRRSILVFAGSLFVTAAIAAFAQDGPPEKPQRPGSGQAGPGGGMFGGFHLVPPFLLERLKLTTEQQKDVADLQKETKAKLYKILTPEQQKTLEEFRPMRGSQAGPGGPEGFRGKPGGEGRGKPGAFGKPDGERRGRGGPGGPGGDGPGEKPEPKPQ